MYRLTVGQSHPWRKIYTISTLGIFSEKPTKEKIIKLFDERGIQYNDRLIKGLLERNVGYLNGGWDDDPQYKIEECIDYSK